MILAIRTDSEQAELYLLDSTGKQIGQKIWQAGRELSQQLLREVQSLVKKDFTQLTGVVVFQGPGSFTGLRIGMSVANAMVEALQIPIIGATGKNWVQDGISKLAKAKVGIYVMPEYGAEPNITKPRK